MGGSTYDQSKMVEAQTWYILTNRDAGFLDLDDISVTSTPPHRFTWWRPLPV